MKIVKQYLRKNKQAYTREQLMIMICRAQAGDKDCESFIIEQNLPFVLSYAHRYYETLQNFPMSFEYDDLFQEGAMGLQRAIKTFDTKSDYEFSTYFSHWVKQHITRYIDENKYSVRMPVYLCELQRQYNKIKMEFGNKDEDFWLRLVAFENDTSVETIKMGLELSFLYIDKGLKGEDGEDQEAQFEDINALISTDEIDYFYLKKMFDFLLDNEKKILLARLEGFTLNAIAINTGLSRERIRQIEQAALIKLKAMTNRVTFAQKERKQNVKQRDNQIQKADSINLKSVGWGRDNGFQPRSASRKSNNNGFDKDGSKLGGIGLPRISTPSIAKRIFKS